MANLPIIIFPYIVGHIMNLKPPPHPTHQNESLAIGHPSWYPPHVIPSTLGKKGSAPQFFHRFQCKMTSTYLCHWCMAIKKTTTPWKKNTEKLSMTWYIYSTLQATDISPQKMHFWVDDFPFFFRWDMWSGNYLTSCMLSDKAYWKRGVISKTRCKVQVKTLPTGRSLD